MWIFLFQKYGKFWSSLLGHFIKHKPLISEEWKRKWYLSHQLFIYIFSFYRVVPCLAKEFVNPHMVPFVLPSVLTIAEEASQKDFVNFILPSLKPVLKLTDPIQVSFNYLKNGNIKYFTIWRKIYFSLQFLSFSKLQSFFYEGHMSNMT